jgi:hypothetical protein
MLSHAIPYPEKLRMVKPPPEIEEPVKKAKKGQVAPPPRDSELRRVANVNGKPAFEWCRWYVLAHEPSVGWCFQNRTVKGEPPFLHGWISPAPDGDFAFVGAWVRGDPRTREPAASVEADCLNSFRIELP